MVGKAHQCWCLQLLPQRWFCEATLQAVFPFWTPLPWQEKKCCREISATPIRERLSGPRGTPEETKVFSSLLSWIYCPSTFMTQCLPLYIKVTMSFRLLAKSVVTLPYTAHLNSLIPCLQFISEVHGEHQLKVRISSTAMQFSKRWYLWWDTRLAAKWQKELIPY